MMRLRRLALLLALLSTLAVSARAGAGEPPLLTLVYTANTLGEFSACPVCGQNGEGGLGRRSTVFKQLRSGVLDRTLFIAGPYEFTPIVLRKPESPDLARALAQAYAMLGYDLGILTPQEKDWLAAAGAPLPAAWQILGSGPRTVDFTRGGMKVAVVLFPAVPMTGDPAAVEATLRAVQAEAVSARTRADLVVGVSPWGEVGERMFLDAAPGAFDLLLGGGQALGHGVREAAGGRTLWVRPPFNGRGLVQLRILALPGGRERLWKQGEQYEGAVRVLEWLIPQDSAVTNLFSWL